MPDIRDLIGIPFVDEGRDPKIGLDCWGLLMVAQRRFGNEVPEFAISPRDHHTIFDKYLSESSNPRWKELGKPEPGCIVAMKLSEKSPRDVQHFGTCIDKYRFLHITRKIMSTISRFDDMRWKNKIVGFHQWIG